MNWCNDRLKVIPLKKAVKYNDITYIGLAVDEEERVKRLKEYEKAPLYEYGITEEQAMKICKKLDLVNPCYKTNSKGGKLLVLL